MAKPLMSPLLLENSNTAQNTLKAIESLNNALAIDTSQTLLSTPRKSTEVKAQVARFQTLDTSDSTTQRLLFRKIVKGFEEQESILAANSYKIQALEVQLEKARPRKQMKVKTSLNSKFASISDIRRTQIAAGEAINEKDDEEGSIHSDSTSDCIEIE